MAYGYSTYKDDLLGRLKKIEGQIRGISRLVENDTYCIDILTQIAAAKSALESVSLKLIESHMNHCVRQAIEKKGPESSVSIDEVITAFKRLL
jgi:DNA-binding FrmR family transcriptional regulator